MSLFASPTRFLISRRPLGAFFVIVAVLTGPAARAVGRDAQAADDLAWRSLGAPTRVEAFEASLTPHMPEVSRPLTQADAVRQEMMAHSRTLSHAQAVRVADLLSAEASREHVDPLLMLAIVAVESSYNHLALSHVGAEGLMQLMPGTAAFLAARGKIARIENHSFDPEINVRLGARYLAELNAMFDGRLETMLTAYNRGPAATRALLRQHHGNLPRTVTKSYAERVIGQYRALKATYGHLERA